MLSVLVKNELKKRDTLNKTKTAKKFNVVEHFFGYQGRSSHPSKFDRKLANTYGYIAGSLIAANRTGYCVTARRLTGCQDSWRGGAIPLICMSSFSMRTQYGQKPVPNIHSSHVDLKSPCFRSLLA